MWLNRQNAEYRRVPNQNVSLYGQVSAKEDDIYSELLMLILEKNH